MCCRCSDFKRHLTIKDNQARDGLRKSRTQNIPKLLCNLMVIGLPGGSHNGVPSPSYKRQQGQSLPATLTSGNPLPPPPHTKVVVACGPFSANPSSCGVSALVDGLDLLCSFIPASHHVLCQSGVSMALQSRGSWSEYPI